MPKYLFFLFFFLGRVDRSEDIELNRYEYSVLSFVGIIIDVRIGVAVVIGTHSGCD